MTALLLTGSETDAGAVDAATGSVEPLDAAGVAAGLAAAGVAASLVGVLELDSGPSKAGSLTKAV
jgi:hypothetical protein